MVGASWAVLGGCFRSSLAILTRVGKSEATSSGRISFFCRNLTIRDGQKNVSRLIIQTDLKARILSKAARQPAYICGASELDSKCLISSAKVGHLLLGRSNAMTFLRVWESWTEMLRDGERASRRRRLRLRASRSDSRMGVRSGRRGFSVSMV